MARSPKALRKSTSSNDDFLDLETQRQARRIGRQQKRLEKETGIANVLSINVRQPVVRFEDLKPLKPLTDTQYDFFQAYQDEQATGYVLYGSAGTGKTLIALGHALNDVLNPDKTQYHKLIIVRSSVQARDQGFLPGDMREKMEAFEAPYHSIFYKLTGKSDAYDKLKDMSKIEFVSTSFLRGDTYDNAIIVVDEYQSMNWHELKTICTRLGKQSKIVFCGDVVQSDLIMNKNDVTGFREFMDVTRNMPSFRHFRFTEDDIVRSGFVKEFIVACNKLGI